jgi:hypothetical protein
MKYCSRKLFLPLLFTALVTLIINGCGTSSPRELQSMTVSPAVADAAHSPNGEVQFTASGTFSKPPTSAAVTFAAPYFGTWSVSNPTIATISSSGLAQCVAGAPGTVNVIASASANSTTAPRTSIVRTATAQLTCP